MKIIFDLKTITIMSRFFERKGVSISKIAEYAYNRFYCPHDVSELFKLLCKWGINVSWIIEAGCHDGSDSKKMLDTPGVERLYAFEPDKVAREKAESLLSSELGKRYNVSGLALMDKSGEMSIDYLEAPGSGNTQIGEKIHSAPKSILATKLDDFPIPEKKDGMIWLDVEGAACKVLIGGLMTLQKIFVVKVEVEFHDMSPTRNANWKPITFLLKKQGFFIRKANINPTYFGDMLFVRRSCLSRSQIVKSTLILGLMLALHEVVYPLLRKPIKKY